MNRYKIIHGLRDFVEEEVTAHIKKGWRICGSLEIHSYNAGQKTVFYQPIWKPPQNEIKVIDK